LDYLQHDMDIGLVSAESARRDYGAVLDESGKLIDRLSTEQRRAILKEEWMRDRLFIDQKTRPFARKAFRTVAMDEQIP